MIRTQNSDAPVHSGADLDVIYQTRFKNQEAEAGAVSLRVRGQGNQGSMPLEQFVTRALSLIESKSMSL